jgi:hypothetical protein
MSLASIQTALDAKLLTYQSTNVAWFGVNFKPKPNTAYIAPSMIGSSRKAVGAGEKGLLEWTGVYRVVARHPSGEGTLAALQKIDAIAAVFPRGLTLTSGSISIVCETPSLMSAQSDGEWVFSSVDIPWFAYEKPS